MKRVFLYSHGFATHADDGGIFSDVASFFPDDTHIMFEYDDWDGDVATAATFSDRAEKLKDKYAEVRAKYPDAEIDLICHSQGCNVAMLAQLDGVKKTIMLTPPMVYGSPEEEYEHRRKNKKSEVLGDGTIIRQRSAGYKTMIKPDFFDDFSLLSDTQGLCNQLRAKTELYIIDALNDDVVKKDYSRLNDGIVVKYVNANHNLQDSGGSRRETEEILRDIFR